MNRIRVRLGVCMVVGLAALPSAALAWGAAAHAAVARAAIRAAEDLPEWFRDGADALSSLAVAPDRWRELATRVPGLETLEAEHFFDLDEWGEDVPADRRAYVARAARRHVDPWRVGFLPYAIAEDYGLLVAAFREARRGQPGGRPAAFTAAGRLAHWAADAVVPLHATRHHHGWVGPNPHRFTPAPGVHAWFETEMVREVDLGAVEAGPEARQTLRDVPAAVALVLEGSLALVPALYAAEQRSRAGDPEAARDLVRRRLDAGTTFLVRLWRTAWVRSAH